MATFRFGDKEIRVVDLEGEPWFVAVDVCRTIGLGLDSRTGKTNASVTTRYLAEDERRVIKRVPHYHRDRAPTADRDIQIITAIGGPQAYAATLISESGLYKLVIRSDKPEAKAFQDWVTREVLPSIRKTPEYFTAQV